MPVARLDVSADGGATWETAPLEPAEDRFAWARYRLPWRPARPGPAVLVARAFDARAQAQPLDAAPWNPKGYCNNRVQRLAVEVA